MSTGRLIQYNKTHRFAVQEGEEGAEQRLDAPLPRRQPHQHLVCCRVRGGHAISLRFLVGLAAPSAGRVWFWLSVGIYMNVSRAKKSERGWTSVRPLPPNGRSIDHSIKFDPNFKAWVID